VVKYSNYRQYRTDVRVIFNGQDITHNGDASQQPNQAPAAQQPNAPATAPKSPPQH